MFATAVHVLVLCASADRIRVLDMTTAVVSTLAGSCRGSTDGAGSDAKFDGPTAIALSYDTTFALVTDSRARPSCAASFWP